jgi:predicted GNAT family N-acyltransferase
MKKALPYAVRIADWTADEGALRAVRHDVFVVEQHVPADLEWDGIDGQCRHAIAEDAAGRAIGCGRLLPDGHIGRMAVRAEWRGHGVGAALLQRLVAMACDQGFERVVLNAQTHATGFYERHGFLAAGPEFDEAGIPHRTMERVLR